MKYAVRQAYRRLGSNSLQEIEIDLAAGAKCLYNSYLHKRTHLGDLKMAEKTDTTLIEKAGMAVGYGIAMAEDVAGAAKTAVGAVVNTVTEALKKTPAKKSPAKKVVKKAVAKKAVKKAPAKKAPAKKAPAKKAVKKVAGKTSSAKKAAKKVVAKKAPAKKAVKKTAPRRK